MKKTRAKKEKTKFRIFLFLLVLIIFWFAPRTRAQEEQAQIDMGPIFFNELMWKGSSVSTSDEWIELYNGSDDVVDLSGYAVYDEVKDEAMIEIEDGQIAPKGYFLISNNVKDHLFSGGESILDIDPDLVDSSVSLSNSSFELSLRDSSGKIIDIAGDGKKPLSGGDCSVSECKLASMQRTNYSVEGDLPEAWEFASEKLNLDEETLDFATPQNSGRPSIKNASLSSNVYFVKKSNSYLFEYNVEDSQDDFESASIEIFNENNLLTDTIENIESGSTVSLQYDYCPKIEAIFTDKSGLYRRVGLNLVCSTLNPLVIINEIMPHPSNIDWNGDGKANSSDEFIEIYNGSDEGTLLDGWKIKDLSGKEFKLDGLLISPKSFLSLTKEITKISINDDGDWLFLIDPSGAINSKIEVPKSSSDKFKDIAYGYFKDGWKWTKSPTPDAVNQFASIEEPVTEKPPASSVKSASVVSQTLIEEPQEEVQTLKIIKTTTTIKNFASAKLADSELKPIVLGARSARKLPFAAFIRLEYLIYFFGFAAFLILVFCYGIYLRE